MPFRYFSAKVPCPWYISRSCISSCHSVIQLSFHQYMCLQNFSCKQRCVWNALVNEATKGIPTSALCRMVFYFVTKPCTEHLAKPQRKCLFPLCKFHFLNVVSPQQLLQSLESLTETNRCILFLGLYQGLEVDLCANSYSSRIFSFVCDLWTGNKKKGFSSCY